MCSSTLRAIQETRVNAEHAFQSVAERYAARYPADRLAVKTYVGQDALEKYGEYNLSCVPAAVVNGVIKIEGTAPDEGTMNNALREGGLWIR